MKLEQPNLSLNTAEKEAREDLGNLGLNFDYLKNKLTLDIGAGSAVIAEVAKQKKAEVISLDLHPEWWTEEGAKLPKVPYVKASAEQLPFPDKTFDLLISHAGPFVNCSSKEILAKMLAEAKRVLKEGGELRFGPGNLNAEIFLSEGLFTPKEEESFTDEQRIQRIEQKSLELLQSIDPNITQEKINMPSHNVSSYHFYVLRKPAETKSRTLDNLEKSTREILWDQKRAEIDEIVDANGMEIDEGIKETVVAFNINGIPTSQSCEGHPEITGGHRPWPWVAVSASGEPQEQFVGETEAFLIAAKQHNIPLEKLKRGHPEKLYWEIKKQILQNASTNEYQEWEKRNQELHTRVTELLDEFYKGREKDIDIKLKCENSNGGSFEVSSESLSLVRFLDNELTDEEKKKLLGLLPSRQQEMRDFTEFLRKKFLANSPVP